MRERLALPLVSQAVAFAEVAFAEVAFAEVERLVEAQEKELLALPRAVPEAEAAVVSLFSRAESAVLPVSVLRPLAAAERAAAVRVPAFVLAPWLALPRPEVRSRSQGI